MSVHDASGEPVGRAVPYAAGDPAVPLVGDDGGDPIRTAAGELVGRVALYRVSGGVAVPITSLGGGVGSEVHATAPLVATPSGDATTLSVQPGTDGQVLTTSGGTAA